jgi:cytidylate kinase
MTNILLQYMVERFNSPALKEPTAIEFKPFITISREYGCPAKEVASCLEMKLNQGTQPGIPSNKWKVISKEIMEQAAHELKVDPTRIERIFNEEKRSTIDEILNSFSEKYYKSDRMIINALSNTIKDFAKKGNIIIIGRNGAGITQDYAGGLHVRLIAPKEWRIQRLIDKGYFKKREEAQQHADDIDYHRDIFMKTKMMKEPVFDIYYNTEKFTSDEISDSIIFHLALKNYKKKS